VPGRNDQDELVRHQGLRLEPAAAWVGAHDSQVDLAVQNRLDDPARVRDLERDGNARVPLAEAADHRRQHVLPRDRARAHQQRARDLSEELIEGLAGLGAQREHLLRVPIEQLPGPCRNGLPAEAVEEPSAELLLE
jgi:hypothetical protein